MIEKRMHLADALRLAMEKEQAAQDFYDEALKVVENPGVAALFEFLRKEEVKHRQLIQDEYDKVVQPDN